VATPHAVNDAERRPSRSALRVTSAISGPGDTIKAVETSRKAKKRTSTLSD
jgi:hypothetical protein